MNTTLESRWLARVAGTCVATLGIVFASASFGEDARPDDRYVTREEYNRVLKELDLIKQKLGVVEERKTAQERENNETFDDYDKQLKEIKSLATRAQPGTTSSLLTGWADAGFADRKGENSSFSASLNPILLWRLNDRLFFEGEVELTFEGNLTKLGLEYANLSYIVDDHLTLKAGRFLAPFGAFADRLHPGWINKLPDQPLAVGEEGISPWSELGVQASGGFAAGDSQFNYAVYISNGPALEEADPNRVGRLNFANFPDSNRNKAVGGRLGFLPVPGVEMGASFQFARVGAGARARLYALDLGVVRDSNALKGVVDVKGQWVWSRVDDVTFDPDGALGFGPLDFRNRRSGGYAQVAYRPSKLKDVFLQNLEAVCRWDKLAQPEGAPGESGLNERRWTLGLNYWLGSSTALKTAYQFGTRREPGAASENTNAVLVQAAMGF